MKAKIKETGEIINVAEYSKITLDRCDSYGQPLEYELDKVEILQDAVLTPQKIDWEQRRYEIAKAALQGICANPNHDWRYEDFIKHSLDFADSFIERLKHEQ